MIINHFYLLRTKCMFLKRNLFQKQREKKINRKLPLNKSQWLTVFNFSFYTLVYSNKKAIKFPEVNFKKCISLWQNTVIFIFHFFFISFWWFFTFQGKSAKILQSILTSEKTFSSLIINLFRFFNLFLFHTCLVL